MKKIISALATAIMGLAMYTSLPLTADAQQAGGLVAHTNKTGQTVTIVPYSDGWRRNKYVVRYAGSTVNHWFAQNGSANAGRDDSRIPTSSADWCRVRYLYNDSVRIPECWGSFMYSSHLITGLNNERYELWFKPSSLDYFKIRNQDTGIWYAHDGSSNDGRLTTTKQQWCDIIIFHMTGIVKTPETCADRLKQVTLVASGYGTPSETRQMLSDMSFVMGAAYDSTKVAGGVLKGSVSGFASVGVGYVVGKGTEELKSMLGWRASPGNAAGIAAETITTTVANSAVTTLIMSAAGASFNPVTAGAGLLVAGTLAGGQALYAASEDTGIVMVEGSWDTHPRYNRDLNNLGTTSFNAPLLSIATTSGPWAWCANEGQTCNIGAGQREVRYGSGGVYATRAVAGGSISCSNGTFGDPTPGVAKTCEVR